jgi:hypothetical protein
MASETDVEDALFRDLADLRVDGGISRFRS